MTCKEKILSEDYGELIVDYTNPFTTEEESQRYCFTRVNSRFGIAYLPQSDLDGIMGSLYVYHTLPKVFGLMADDFDPISLISLSRLLLCPRGHG